MRTSRAERRPDRPLPSQCPHATGAERRSLIPILVRNRRVNGHPRQIHIASLPAIRTCCANDPMVRAAWWEEIENKVEWLWEVGRLELGPEDGPSEARGLVRGMLVGTVPFPTPDEWAAFRAQENERMRQEGERIWAEEERRRAEREAERARDRERQRQEEERRLAEQRAAAAREVERRRQEILQRQEAERRRAREEAERRARDEAERRAREEAERRARDEEFRRLMDELRRLGEEAQRPAAAQGGNSLQSRLSVLGLRWPCTEEEIKRAYRKLALLHHPDRGGDPANFKAVQVAYDEVMNLLRS